MRSIAIFVLILGCGNSRGPIVLPPLSAYPSCSTCQHAQFVVSQMVIPETNAQAVELGCDINGDGEIDNQLGKVIGATRAACGAFDAQVSTNAAFQSGSLIMLYDVEYDSSPTTQVAGLRAFVGAHDPSDGLSAPAFYMGQGRFTVGVERGSGMGGSIQNGAADFGPNNAVVQLALFPNQPAIVVPLERGSLSGAFGATTIQEGKLCGAIDAQDMRTLLFPQIADYFSDVIKRRTACSDYFASLFDADHSCDTDPACVPSSAAPCHCISEAELENNSIIKSLLSPDLDLDPNKTNPFVTDPYDPTYRNDAISFGAGITANAATFPLP
jgi:hypothetical protein